MMEGETAAARARTGASGRPLVVVLAATGVLALGAALLSPAEVATDGSAVSLVVGHPVVVGALRTVVVVLALFLVASAVARAASGSWVRRVGPVDASTEVVEVASDSDRLRTELDRAKAEVTRLTGELTAAMDLLDEMADTPTRSRTPDEEVRR
ncbi:hypothetical protein [uncultured Pseudokineococcus sp.]|uniref:hypothetical protein n=1 Tax=uncultured Pseudokineococcus sp. TaxID=1642928 RepID=UPI00260D30E7|nr:hypothetical protein [uncultured Pseudokineococcus sp.]